MDDPSLVLDRRAEAGIGPGLHAIIIGVSEYSFLPAADDPPGEDLGALQKLESSALSGWRFAEKLKSLDAEKRLFRPLKTLRLLLAPSAKEIATEAALANPGGLPPVSDNIRKTLALWRQDIAASQGEQALFHFSGHGIRRSLEETILLAADFLDPAFDAVLEKAFSLRNIYNGMVPSPKRPEIGREQFYFVDACRDKPDALDKIENTDTPKVFEPFLGSFDDRKAPIFFATKTGGSAAGVPGQVTYFTAALLWALDHGAFNATEVKGIDGTVWPITAQSLKVGVEAADLLFENRVELTGLVADPALCFRRDPPRVSLKMEIKPQTAHASVAKVALRDLDSDAELLVVAPEPDHPWASEIPAGHYRLFVEGVPGSFPATKSTVQFFNIQTKMPWGFTIGSAI
jgi:Caspase domain